MWLAGTARAQEIDPKLVEKADPESVGDAADKKMGSVLDVLERLQEQAGIDSPVETLLYAIAFISGLALVAKSLTDFVKFGSDPNRVPFSQPMLYFLAGIFLVQLGATTDTASETLGVSDVAFAYAEAAGSSTGGKILEIVFEFLHVIGIVTVMRALFLMPKIDGRQFTVGQVITHLVSGLLLMNFEWTSCTMLASFGWGDAICGG
ncbi:hypothetical protein CKO28_18535 [Rhodovibrio sodomensis]|uniref:Uncharacterized protein n=2 Tax=Rhodovibrio sodomensis TaxID=1088 RepID=A0ABS1DHU3_9PROT|nr:hypothetical protein [Rhodovibrio sodomensis]